MVRFQKGQIWSMDLISASVLLIFIILLIMLAWNTLIIRWNIANEYRQMNSVALIASEVLLSGPGNPPSWEVFSGLNESNLKSMGIVYGRNVLNPQKLGKLISLNNTTYDFFKQRLGAGKYDFGMNITDMNRNTSSYLFGKFPAQLNVSVILERMAVLNQTPVIVRFVVWR